MKYAVGSFVLIGLIWMVWHTAFGSITFFVHLPTLMMFIIAAAAVIFITGEFKTLVRAVNALFSKKYNISSLDKEKAINLYRLLGKAVICTAMIFMLSGLVGMLGALDDPSAMGPMIAIALLTPLYAALINLVFIYPAIHILKTRLNAESKAVISEKQVVDKMLELCYRQGISPEDILEATEITFKKQ